MEKINKTAARFKEVRLLLGLTQLELGKRLMLKRNTVAKIESGSATASARTLSILESLLNKSTNIDAATDKIPALPNSLAENVAPFGDADSLREEIRRKVDAVITAAGADRVRLGWILSQINEYVAPQSHWASAPSLDELRQRAAALAAKHARPVFRSSPAQKAQ